MATHTQDENEESTRSKIGGDEITISVLKEEVKVDKLVKETGTVTIRKTFETTPVDVPLTTVNTGFREERVDVNRVIDQMPEIRQEEDRVIIPVVREEEIVIKRLVLVEEIHLIREVERSEHTERVELRKDRIDIKRE